MTRARKLRMRKKAEVVSAG